MASKDSLEFSAQVSADEAAEYLEALARSLREGRALFESGDRSISLELGPSVKIELEAESDPTKGKSSVDLSLSWRAAEPVMAAPSLTIVAGGQGPSNVGDDD
ncbi:MAG TPA: amphi-Trp domain-containing protein [Dehalococcoidia bacterium]|jgi:amphi-Trp domain-containing protein